MRVTWRLWRALRSLDARHPLFERAADAPYPALLPGRRIPWRWVALALLAALALNAPGVVLALPVLLPVSGVMLLLFAPLLFPLALHALGALWAAGISATIDRARATGIYDLTAASPAGRLAASWALAGGGLHRGGWLDAADALARILMRLGGGLLLLLAAMGLWVIGGDLRGPGLTPHALETTRTLLDMAALLAGFYLHYIQSVLLAALAGMLIPTLGVGARLDGPLLAGVLYLALQAGFYAACAALYVLARPLLLAGPGDLPAPVFLLLPLLALGMWYGLREALIGWLWAGLERRLGDGRAGLAGVRRAAPG